MLRLYAVVAGRPPASLGMGLGRTTLETSRILGLRLVFDRGPVPVVTPANLRAYDRVVRRLCRTFDAVLPFRFGSAAPDRAALRSLLAPATTSLDEALTLVSGAAQFTLRVYGPPEAPPRPSRGDGPGARYLTARRFALTVPEIAGVTAATRALVRAARVERHERPPLLASVYHLVLRSDVRAYRSAVAAAAAELHGIRLDLRGPFPPYAFAGLP